jgi:hypothetical protein
LRKCIAHNLSESKSGEDLKGLREKDEANGTFPVVSVLKRSEIEETATTDEVAAAAVLLESKGVVD